jgi:hypothetical protein
MLCRETFSTWAAHMKNLACLALYCLVLLVHSSVCNTIDTLYDHIYDSFQNLQPLRFDWDMLCDAHRECAITFRDNGPACLLRTDSLGRIILTKYYNENHQYDGTTKFDSITRPHSLIKTSDSGFAIAGVINGRMALIRTDKSGNLLWVKRYGYDGKECSRSSNSCWRTNAYKMIQLPDKGFLLAGSSDTTSYTIPIPVKGFLQRTNENGDSVWTRYFDSSGALTQMMLMPNNTIAVSAGNVLYCLDGNGAVLWQKQLFSSSGEILYLASNKNHNTVAIAGRFASSMYNLILIEIDSNGQIINSRYFCNDSLLSDPTSFIYMKNDDVILCGTMPYGIATVIRLSPSLDSIWRWKLQWSSFSSRDFGSTPKSICALDDSTFCLSGTANLNLWISEIGYKNTNNRIKYFKHADYHPVQLGREFTKAYDVFGRPVSITPHSAAQGVYFIKTCNKTQLQRTVFLPK